MERHTRKYAEGELGEDKSFYFRGPDNALNLRAQNLTIFLQMAEGVDDETWRHHLKNHDVSRWMREAIKDEALAGEAQEVEEADRDPAVAPRHSRGRRAPVHRACGDRPGPALKFHILGFTHEMAWFLCHRLGEAMRIGDLGLAPRGCAASIVRLKRRSSTAKGRTEAHGGAVVSECALSGILGKSFICRARILARRSKNRVPARVLVSY